MLLAKIGEGMGKENVPPDLAGEIAAVLYESELLSADYQPEQRANHPMEDR